MFEERKEREEWLRELLGEKAAYMNTETVPPHLMEKITNNPLTFYEMVCLKDIDKYASRI